MENNLVFANECAIATGIYMDEFQEKIWIKKYVTKECITEVMHIVLFSLSLKVSVKTQWHDTCEAHRIHIKCLPHGMHLVNIVIAVIIATIITIQDVN